MENMAVNLLVSFEAKAAAQVLCESALLPQVKEKGVQATNVQVIGPAGTPGGRRVGSILGPFREVRRTRCGGLCILWLRRSTTERRGDQEGLVEALEILLPSWSATRASLSSFAGAPQGQQREGPVFTAIQVSRKIPRQFHPVGGRRFCASTCLVLLSKT